MDLELSGKTAVVTGGSRGIGKAIARDIAYVVAFLASPKSLAINGDVIAAGGGAPRSIHY